MTSSEPYKLLIKTVTRSKAKFLRFRPMKSFVEREKLGISFEVENMSEKAFPGAELRFFINWKSEQQVKDHFPIPPLAKNKSHKTHEFITDALSDGFALVYISMKDVRDEQNKLRSVEFYSGRRVEHYIDTRASIHSIKVKSWEEIYEFSAMVIAAISLLIIAAEKVVAFILWISSILPN